MLWNTQIGNGNWQQLKLWKRSVNREKRQKITNYSDYALSHLSIGEREVGRDISESVHSLYIVCT
jgi:hypothetical protein